MAHGSCGHGPHGSKCDPLPALVVDTWNVVASGKISSEFVHVLRFVLKLQYRYVLKLERYNKITRTH